MPLFEVAPDGSSTAGDHEIVRWLLSLSALLNLTVTAQLISADGELALTFDDDHVLTVSGTPSASTVGEPWWIGKV